MRNEIVRVGKKAVEGFHIFNKHYWEYKNGQSEKYRD